MFELITEASFHLALGAAMSLILLSCEAMILVHVMSNYTKLAASLNTATGVVKSLK